MTNFGKRRHISAASGLRPVSLGSQRVVEMIASTKRPDADPDVAADHLHQCESPDRLIRRARDAGGGTGVSAISLRGGEAGGVGEFGRADPGAGDAGRQSQPQRDDRQHEDHHDRPKDHQR